VDALSLADKARNRNELMKIHGLSTTMKDIVPTEHDPIILEAFKRLSVRFCLVNSFFGCVDLLEERASLSKLQELVILSEKSAEIANSRLENFVILSRTIREEKGGFISG